MLPSAFENENNYLKTVNSREQDDCDEGKLARMRGDKEDEISEVDDCCGKNQRTKEIDEDDEPHTETTETTHVVQQHQLHKIVYRTKLERFTVDLPINPTTSLRNKN